MAFRIVSAVLFLAFLSASEGLATVPQLVPEWYVGRWYQMYTNEFTNIVSNIDDPACITADYGAINATYITVYNYNYDLNTLTPDSIEGYGYIPNVSDPGKLLVYLEGVPVLGDYWIFKLGPVVDGQYQYSLVSEPLERQLFVLARDPVQFNELYDAEVQEYLTLKGFADTPLKAYTPVLHTEDCVYI